jgi:hypothetical protein
MLPLRFDLKLFVVLFVVFIVFTCIGTLTHEMGHIAIAKMLGYETHLGYGYMNYDKTNGHNLKNGLFISIGGPLQTMLTGTIGLTLLFLRRKKFNLEQNLSWGQWALIFITLFWLRQSTNMIMSIPGLLAGRLLGGDEFRIAYLLRWPLSSISVVTGLIGLLVLATVILRFIPQKHRVTFMLAGLAGGVTGFWLWLIKLGPVLMP